MRAAALAVVCACGGQPAPPTIGNTSGVPRMIATSVSVIIQDEYDDHFELDEVSPAGVRRLVRTDGLPSQYGWLDAQTAIVLLAGGDDQAVLERYHAGARIDTITIPASEWKPENSPKLAITKTGEAWLADCDVEEEHCASYLRVWPAPHTRSAQPAGVDPARVAGRFHRTPPPATASAPAGLAIAFTKAMNGDGTVTCSSPAGKITTDKLRPLSTRWVQTSPPVFEVVADDSIGDGTPSQRSYYLRACDDTIYDDFHRFDDGMWVLGHQAADVGMDLTFFVGDKPIGTIERGGSFVANR